MSEADAHEGATVRVDGVVVEKTYELDEFPVPAVMLVVRSERDDAATIRFTDPLPSDVSVDDVGLHPNYGESALSIEDGAVVFERELEPGEEFTAVYGLREVEESDLASVPADPEVDEVSPPLAESSSQAIRDVIEGIETEQEESEPEDDSDEEVETLELRDPNDETASEAVGADEPGPAAASAGPEPDQSPGDESDDDGDEGDIDVDLDVSEDAGEPSLPTDAEGIASALAAELRTGDVDDEVVALLRQELDLGSGSTEARIQRLQSEVADLHAYTEALEEFLDENGTTQQLLSDIRTELDRLDTRVGGNRERLSEQAEDVDAVTATVESVESEVADLRRTVQSYEGTVEQVRETVSTVEETTADLASDLEEYQTDLDELESHYNEEIDDLEARVDEVEHLETRLDEMEDLEERYEQEVEDLTRRVEDVSENVSGVREEVERVADEVEDIERVESRLDDLEETVSGMSSDLDEVAGIQQRLQSVFAGPVDDSDDEDGADGDEE